MWDLLKSKNILKTELRNIAQISSSTYIKLNNNENITVDILIRICEVLNCDIKDIVECKNYNKYQYIDEEIEFGTNNVLDLFCEAMGFSYEFEEEWVESVLAIERK